MHFNSVPNSLKNVYFWKAGISPIVYSRQASCLQSWLQDPTLLPERMFKIVVFLVALLVANVVVSVCQDCATLSFGKDYVLSRKCLFLCKQLDCLFTPYNSSFL